MADETTTAESSQMILETAAQIADHTSSKTPVWWLIVTLVLGFAALAFALKWMAAKLKEQRDDHAQRLIEKDSAYHAIIEKKDSKLEEITTRFLDTLEKGNIRMEQVVMQNTHMGQQLLQEFKNHSEKLEKQAQVSEDIAKHLKV